MRYLRRVAEVMAMRWDGTAAMARRISEKIPGVRDAGGSPAVPVEDWRPVDKAIRDGATVAGGITWQYVKAGEWVVGDGKGGAWALSAGLFGVLFEPPKKPPIAVPFGGLNTEAPAPVRPKIEKPATRVAKKVPARPVAVPAKRLREPDPGVPALAPVAAPAQPKSKKKN